MYKMKFLYHAEEFSLSDWKSKLCYKQRSVGQSVLVSGTHLGLTTRSALLSDSCGFCWHDVPSLIRGWVYSLKLLLGLARSVIPRSKSCRTHDHMLLSQIWDPPNWRATSPYLYLPGTGWPSYTSGGTIISGVTLAQAPSIFKVKEFRLVSFCAYIYIYMGANRSIVVKALCYKPEGCRFETRWGEWFLSSYLILPAALGPGVYSPSKRNEYQKHNNNVSGE
jgi:hypothetical protein